MAIRRNSCLNSQHVRNGLRQAWDDSNPGDSGGHEEGGFILRDAEGVIEISRWARGERDSIHVPSHPACTYDGKDIVASFHTHPNTSSDYLQEPSETDVRGIREDQDLKGEAYEGEFVVSNDIVYLVTPNGSIREVGDTREVLDAE